MLEASPEFVSQQLDCVFTDIPPDGVKTGMVSSSGIIGRLRRSSGSMGPGTWWWTR